MWLLHMEKTDGVQIMQGRNGCKFKPLELPRFSVDGYCIETLTIYALFVCYYHGLKFQPFRDVSNVSADTLVDRYEQTLSLLEQITRAGYLVKVQWKCEFHDAGIVRPELLVLVQ